MFDDEFYSTASGFLKSQVMQIPDGQRKLQQSSRQLRGGVEMAPFLSWFNVSEPIFDISV